MKPVLSAFLMVQRGIALLLMIAAGYTVPAMALPIQLLEGTATYSETCCAGVNSPDKAVDGIFIDQSGGGLSSAWAIASGSGGPPGANQTAVWETAMDVGSGIFEFRMYFLHENPYHLLGRFRFSVTTDDRSIFADGLAQNGDVSANWTILTNATVQGPAGMTFTILPDESILAGGVVAPQGVYVVTYVVPVSGITGVRLETLQDASLPFDGPGLAQGNGNFHLTELVLNASVPEPSTLALFGLALAGLGSGRRKHKTAPA